MNQCNLHSACRIIKATILLTNQLSKLPHEEKRVLFDAVAKKINDLVEHVNSKRIEAEKLPPECNINIEKLLAISPKSDIPPPLSLSKEPSVSVPILSAPPSPSPSPSPTSLASHVIAEAQITAESQATPDKVASSDDAPKATIPAALYRKKRRKKAPATQTRRVSARLLEKQAKATRS